ncbi:MAG: sigma-E factor negative regulatory protein [Acidiferrobacterales bacterium]
MTEHISALMDAELSEHERARVLKALAHDRDLRGTWERYHIIRAALNEDLGPVSSTDLGARIAERIGQLPAPELQGDVRRWKPAMRWAGNLALAASVAAVTILGVQWFVSSDPPGTPQQATSPRLWQADIQRVGLRWDTRQPEVARQLNIYLVEHNEFMPTSGMNGVMSYGRFVSYDNSP